MNASAFSFPASIAGALVVASVPAQAQDTWSGADKRWHAGFSCVFALGATSWKEKAPAWQQWAVAMGPGVVKEALDARPGGSGWSWKDLGADALGAAACVPIGRFVLQHAAGKSTVTYTLEF